MRTGGGPMPDSMTREEAEGARWQVVWNPQVENHIILPINDVAADDDVFSMHEDLDEALETLGEVLEDYPDPVEQLPEEVFIDAEA